jgi:hypothetical protein
MNTSETISTWRTLLAKSPLFSGFQEAELDLLLAQARERKMRTLVSR